jgi:hypothetical protein
LASCNGVTSIWPWPMPTLMVSPGNQTWNSGLLYARFFHSVEGTMPSRSPSISMPVAAPRPNFERKPAILSMPIRRAISKK